jgi:hypothetical protein
MTNEKHRTLISAADFFNTTSRKLLVTENGLHAETLIVSVSRMAGSLMYRSFDLDKSISAGTTVLSEQANIYGPQLMNTLFATLTELGHPIGEAELDKTFLSSKLSQLSFKESIEKLSPFYLKYCEVASISLQDGAFGAAISAGLLVHDCRDVLSVEKGAALAVYGFVEGTKTAPGRKDD